MWDLGATRACIKHDMSFLYSVYVVQVDEHDVPTTQLIIRDAEVLWNPFDDVQPRVDKEDKKAAREEAEALQKQR